MEHASKIRDGTPPPHVRAYKSHITLTFTSKTTFTQTFRSKFKHSEVHFDHIMDYFGYIENKI